MKLGGFGGERMAAAGVKIMPFSLAEGVVGWTGVLRRLPEIAALFRKLRRRFKSIRPSAVLLIDNPGFNLRVAKIAAGYGIPVYYYVCPQVWAWGAQRLLKMRRLLTRAFPILPFEEPLFQAFGIRARFVGHPLLELIPPPASRPDGAKPWVLLLPGSRRDEIAQHLPVLLEAGRRLAREKPRLGWTIAATPETSRQISDMARGSGLPDFKIVAGANYALRSRPLLCWTASGTATLEQGLLGVPQVVVYRMNPINWWIIRRMATVSHVCLVNLVLGRQCVTELLQSDFTADALLAVSRRMLREDGTVARARKYSRELRDKLAGPGATNTVADTILRDLGF